MGQIGSTMWAKTCLDALVKALMSKTLMPR